MFKACTETYCLIAVISLLVGKVLPRRSVGADEV